VPAIRGQNVSASGPARIRQLGGCGGIGRRARFRSVWGRPRGGSSPLIRTTTLSRTLRARCLGAADSADVLGEVHKEIQSQKNQGRNRQRDPRSRPGKPSPTQATAPSGEAPERGQDRPRLQEPLATRQSHALRRRVPSQSCDARSGSLPCGACRKESPLRPRWGQPLSAQVRSGRSFANRSVKPSAGKGAGLGSKRSWFGARGMTARRSPGAVQRTGTRAGAPPAPRDGDRPSSRK
jgi:hypothetical protein